MMSAVRNLIDRRRGLEAADPVLFARRAGVDPDHWQADLLKSEAKQMALCCSRQAGKSTASALIGLHAALYRAPALVLLLAPALRQSQELFRKIRDALNQLGETPAEVAEESSLRIEFSNRSRIITLPGKEATIRGYSGAALLVVDEAARVDDNLYQAVRPMMATSGGRIILLSTPFGRRGFFYREWDAGGPDWLRIRITAEECRRIPRAWLEQERRQIPAWTFEQEYLCTFVDPIDSYFRGEDINKALDHGVRTPDWW